MHKLDFVERIRRWLIPKLGLSGRVTSKQYVGTIQISIELFERVLHDRGFLRNSPAYFKRETDDGDLSVGSWVYLPNGYFGTFQHHFTIFPGREVYVHEEYNWRRHPILHLKEAHFAYPTRKWRRRLIAWGVPIKNHPEDA